MTKEKKEQIKHHIVSIRGNDYLTVAGRIELAHQDLEELSITTEVLSSTPVVIKATVVTKKGTFTGISSVATNTVSNIEKFNPYEVSETSAIGRALGFAGYGIVEGMATADEVHKSEAIQSASHTARNTDSPVANHTNLDDVAPIRDCPVHPGKQAKYKSTPWGGTQWSHPEATEEKGWCNIKAS